MTTCKRTKSLRYSGVYWREDETGEKMYYIRYRTGGRGSKEIEEPIGKSSSGMTEAKASHIRSARISGKEKSNKDRRENAKIQIRKDFTLRDAWNLYCEAKSASSQLRTDKSLIKFFPNLMDRSINTLTTQDITILRKKLEHTQAARPKGETPSYLAPATVVHVLGFIRRLINFAVMQGLCPRPENLIFTMPKVDNQKIEMLTDNQLENLLKALDEEPNQDAAALIRLALVTGMRKGALLGLRWDDCDFEHKQIRLRGESAKKGKTEYIPMTPAARSVLKSIQDKSSDYVFPGKNGGQRKEFRRIANRVKQKAGLPEDFRPLHGLRHNFASRLASSGQVELYTLQRLLTHSSPQMTQRYAHLRDETLRKAAELADNMLTRSISSQTTKK